MTTESETQWYNGILQVPSLLQMGNCHYNNMDGTSFSTSNNYFDSKRWLSDNRIPTATPADQERTAVFSS